MPYCLNCVQFSKCCFLSSPDRGSGDRPSVLRLWRRWLSATGLVLSGLALLPLTAWGQLDPVIRDRFLNDPEFTQPRDPLLPEIPVARPLSPLEKSELEIALNQIALEAEQLYFLGQADRAFELWMREVRLRRIFGYAEEIQAMQRVGLRAWEDSRAQEIQLLTLRLRQIQTELLEQDSSNIFLFEAIAATFEVLRDIDSATAVYNTLIAQATSSNNVPERQRLLENLANLQEAWFRFEAAGKTYQALLGTLSSTSVSATEARYLAGGIRNYQNAGQLRTVIDYQRRLLRYYENTAALQAEPSLLLAIARNYRDIEELSEARNYYLTSYTKALAQNQSSVAKDVVQDLAVIYTRLGRPDDVLYLHRQQLAVEGLSYSGYGLMQVFDDLGQFYISQDNLEQAISAYQEGLILARYLGYREIYFQLQLQQLLVDTGRLTVTLAEKHEHDRRVQPLQPPRVWQGNNPSPEP